MTLTERIKLGWWRGRTCGFCDMDYDTDRACRKWGHDMGGKPCPRYDYLRENDPRWAGIHRRDALLRRKLYTGDGLTCDEHGELEHLKAKHPRMPIKCGDRR